MSQCVIHLWSTRWHQRYSQWQNRGGFTDASWLTPDTNTNPKQDRGPTRWKRKVEGVVLMVGNEYGERRQWFMEFRWPQTWLNDCTALRFAAVVRLARYSYLGTPAPTTSSTPWWSHAKCGNRHLSENTWELVLMEEIEWKGSIFDAIILLNW